MFLFLFEVFSFVCVFCLVGIDLLKNVFFLVWSDDCARYFGICRFKKRVH